MKTKHVVYSLIVTDLKKSFAFYKDGLGISNATMQEGVITLDLPGMLLFLADEKNFTKYTSLANIEAYYPKNSVEGFFSCAIESREEVDAILDKAKAAGGEVFPPQIKDHFNGLRQYIGSFKDPDGHLWQLVYNIGKVI